MAFLIQSPAIGEDIPRLFASEKGPHLQFFLPITHSSTPSENDPGYLNEVVRRAFRHSSILYEESPGPFGAESFFSGCGEELEDKALDDDLHELFSKAVEGSAFWEPYKPVMNLVSRFTKFSHILKPQEWSGSFRNDATIGSSVPRNLHAAHPIPSLSIETTDEVFRAYCAVSAKTRRDSIRAVLADHRQEILREKPPTPAESILQGADRDYVMELQRAIGELQGMANTAPPRSEDDELTEALHTLLVTPRNDLWIRKINQIANTTAVPFYALGVAHFPSQKSGKGLIALLRDEGYSVTLIKNRDELYTILRRHYERNAIPR